jgi:glucose/arabinose dehydrogenase
MSFKNYIFLVLIFSGIVSFAQPKVKLDTFSRTFTAPIGVENDGYTSRVFIVQQNGIIWTMDSNGVKLDTFIDLRAKVQNSGEEGLLGMAFHPDYKNNGYFYTYYTKKSTTDNAVFRYKVSSNPNRANIDSQLLVINFSHPIFTNHNGGCIRFGKDGYLYIGTGDGGSGGDPNNNAQNKNNLLGKLHRLDVNNFAVPYTVPANNPFVGQTNVKTEIWAYGLRNPWRYSFDRETGDLWLADVGQNTVEETNFQSVSNTGGDNYGWRCYEGNSTYNTSGCSGASNYKFPFFTYGRNGATGGFSVTGGFIYKGNKYNDLRGYYIFTDYVSGNFWLTQKKDTVFTTVQQTSPKQANISSFGEDIRGELYATNLSNGVVYKIRELCSPFQISLFNKKNPSCPNVANGSITFTSVGSNGSVSYSWSNGNNGSTISNLAPNKYVVTATDGIGCVRKDSVVLFNQDTLRTSLTKQNPSCPNVTNGQITAQALDGFGPITYNWSNGGNTATINNLAPNKYVVTVTDSVGCSAKDSVVLFNADTLDKPIIIKSNDTLFTASGFIYKWYKDGILISDANQSFYKILLNGSYKVEITDINGCKAMSDSLSVIITSVKNKNADLEKFSLYPNPANDNLIIDIRFNSNKKSTLKIINSIGQIMYSEILQGKDFLKTISLQSFAKGLYQLSIFTEDGQVSTQTFVKE